MKMNVSVSLEPDDAIWLKHHADNNNTKISLIVGKWVKNLRQSIELEGSDDIRVCPKCGAIFSFAEFRKTFMRCPTCKEIVAWPAKKAEKDESDLDAVLAAKPAVPDPAEPAPPQGGVVMPVLSATGDVQGEIQTQDDEKQA